MTDALIGHGAVFAKVNATSPEDLTTIAEVTNISGPSLARDAVDATHMQSSEKWREFIAGLKDGGEVTIDMNFIPGNTTMATIRGLFDTDLVGQYRITWPDSPASRFGFEALCTGFSPEAPVDGKMSASVTFKVTGEPQFV